MPQLAQRHWSLIAFGATTYRAGTTLFGAPQGKIIRLGTFTSKTFRDFVFYEWQPREFLDRRLSAEARIQTYPNTVPTPPGHFEVGSVTDKGYRAERGIYTRDNRHIILWPHLESGEHVLIEWSGRKTAFDDDEPVDLWHYERDVSHLLALHLQKQMAGLNDGNAGDYQIADKEWRESLSRLKIQAKDDEDPTEILWDTGLLPRSCMPAMATASCALPTEVDTAMPFFKDIWMFCEDDGNYYNLWSLAHGEIVILDLGTSTATAGSSGSTPTPAAALFYYSGVMAIASGVDSGSVTGLGLAFTPTKVTACQVLVPSGGDLIDAWPVAGTLTAGGFDFVLNGVTPSTGYFLNFRIER